MAGQTADGLDPDREPYGFSCEICRRIETEAIGSRATASHADFLDTNCIQYSFGGFFLIDLRVPLLCSQTRQPCFLFFFNLLWVDALSAGDWHRSCVAYRIPSQEHPS
jgi:hypothetical protein